MIEYISFGLMGLAGTVIAALLVALTALAVFVGLRTLWLLVWDGARARLGRPTYATAVDAAYDPACDVRNTAGEDDSGP